MRIRLTVAPPDGEPPWRPDLRVREEDTFRVLSADRTATPPAEDLGTLSRAAARAEPLAPGTVVPRPGDPPELLAVVHDLDRRPTWRAEWVDAALREVMREADARGASSLALPILGAVHGGIDPFRFLRGLEEAVRSTDPWALERICVLRPEGVDAGTGRAMARRWEEGEPGG